ncbi:MAG TPA: PAS domain S-box protein, partial [Dehalococcoidia bacterium]|nr:PAS domain S-box protein [Dehalococcoidia bacterium]
MTSSRDDRPTRRTRAPRGDEDPNDPQSLLDAAVSSIVQAVGGRAGLVRLWEDHPAQEIASSSYGLSEQAIDRLRPIVDEWLPRLDPDVGGSILAKVDQSALGPLEVGGEPLQAVALPLRAGDRLIGLLCLFQPADSAPEAALRDARLQRMAAGHVDVVIQNARLLERLLEEKRWLEAVVRYSADGIMILDAAGRIVGLNPAFERIIGRRTDQVRGRACRAVLQPETRAGTAICPGLCPLLAGRAGPNGTATIELT